jgi:hypothetical protein
MTIDALQQLWKAYLDAYSDIAVAERERLLRQSVTDDIVFTSPTGEGQGFGNLLAHIAQFQKQFPGAYFKCNKLFSHHGQLLSEWTMFNKDGSDLRTAHTFARLDAQGRLAHLAGFF